MKVADIENLEDKDVIELFNKERKARRFVFCALSLFLFAVGCGKGHEYGERQNKGGESVYKGEMKRWNFDSGENGKIPNGFSSQMTGKGGPGKWETTKDHTATSTPNVLVQTSQEYSGYHFSMAINEKEIYDDLKLSVKFKGVKGKEDQGGGPVWRYQDADNYYIARANPLENNFRVYKGG
ncbi:MAG: hypothetical protein MRK02_10460 [Candidatus Scalindua sp.]|nr:hypothetical protein [Candidatus Scalindua sp.]